MNEKFLISKAPYNLKRVFAKVCMTVGQLPLLPPTWRYTCLKYGGLKFKGKCFIGSKVLFDGIYPNLIGEGCIITSGTHILSHFFNTKDRRFYAGKVVIGRKVFIGMNTLIVNAVNIGDGAIIGAGSIINRDIPAGEIWAGNSARFIKKIDEYQS